MGFRRFLTLVALLCTTSCSSEEDSGPNVPAGSMMQRDGYTILFLHGTPYEMGYQHGTLLRPKLQEAAQFLFEDPVFKLLRDAAKFANLEEVATENSYPWMLEECQGLVDAVADPGFGIFECLLVNFGDVAMEFLKYGMPEAEDLVPGCSQVVASGSATPDGALYHARILDWTNVAFVVDNPVIFIRRPLDAIPHLFVGFPGNLSSYQGMNAHGIVVASNEVNPLNTKVNDRKGRSHVQMVVEILTHATSLDEARNIAIDSNHMSLETLVVSDGKARRGEVFELAPQFTDVRGMHDDVVFATNHFLGEKTSMLDKDPPSDSTLIRWERLEELVLPESEATLHGSLDPVGMIRLMRDRVNPRTGLESDVAVDDGLSLATNGALYQVVFAPEKLSLWVAAGKLPVSQQPFIGLNLGEFLGMEGYAAPATLP